MATHNPYDDTALRILIDIIDAICDEILEDTDAIREVTDAEAILTETSGSITTTAAEQNVYVNVAPAGVFRPVCFKIDMTNQTATETIVLRLYYRIAPGGALIRFDTMTYVGVTTEEGIKIDLDPTRYGIQVTIEKTAGTNRAYVWEVFYEVAP